MKNCKRLLFFTGLIFFAWSITIAGEAKGKKSASRMQKLSKLATIDDYTRFDVNNISTYVRNNGSFNRDPVTSNAGFEWPKGTGNTAIFASGLWLGGKINDTIHTAIAEYSSEYLAGAMAFDVDPTDPRWHVYKIKRGDNALNNQDYANWPFDDGAPALKNYLGTADSIDGTGHKIPLLLGDMTSWTVFNDNEPSRHSATLTLPIGMEVQLTTFGYDNTGILGNVLFYKWKLINKSGRQIDSVYVCIWGDVDIGLGASDYDGCDTLLGLGYTYSANSVNPQYGSTPPAAGFDFLQGPIVPGEITDTVKLVDGRIFPGKKMLKMTSYIFYNNDPSDWGNPLTGQEVFNYFQALSRTGQDTTDPAGNSSKFMFSGDPNLPASTANWIEEGVPGDRRFMMTSGPFTMQPEDTQEVIAANLIAQGNSNLNSVTKLKQTDTVMQSLFDINTPPMPTITVNVSYPNSIQAGISILANARSTSVTGMIALLRRQDESVVTGIQLYDDGNHNDGLANDGLFGNITYITREPQGLYIDLQIENSLGQTFTWEHFYDLITTIGSVDIIGSPIIFSDNLNNDFHVNPGENIRYGFSIQNNTGAALSNIIITPSDLYSTQSQVIGSFAADSIFSIQSANYFDFRIDAGYQDTIFQVSVLINDNNYNRWRYTLTFRVYLFAQPTYGIPLIHTAGKSDWGFKVTVVDTSLIQDHTYELSFTGTGNETRTMSLQDLNTLSYLFSGLALPDSLGHSIPYTNGFKIMGGVDYGRAGINYSNSVEWNSISAPWFHGEFAYDYSANRYTYILPGEELTNNFGYFLPSFDMTYSVPVEIHFNALTSQKAYRLRRVTSGTPGYYMPTLYPFIDVPFTAWDVSDTLNPRQLSVAWRDNDNDETWNPTTDATGNLELILVYYKTYDPTGTTQFVMPPYASPDDSIAAMNQCTQGANADIVYGILVSLLSGHTLNESIGSMDIQSYLAPNAEDRYRFNPEETYAEEQKLMPKVFSLSQNYPNPFNPSTTIQFTTPTRGIVNLKIYNLLGQEIIELVNSEMNAGDHKIVWNGKNSANLQVASGIYFYRLTSGKFGSVKKMLLIK